MSNKLTLSFANGSHVGLKRTSNQDSYGKFPEDSDDLSAPQGQLFIVADGMGGHKAGERASQLAVSIIQREYFAHHTGEIASSLHRAFQAANRQIYDDAQQNPAFEGMGTTCIAMVFKDEHAYIAHVGDSRAYRVTRELVEQLTKDHSQVAEMFRKGILTEMEARTHPERSILTRALGARDEVEIDLITDIPLHAGESYLLCTDGLANVTEKEIKRTILSHPPRKACEKLIQLANDRGGEDNVTVQVIRLETSKAVTGGLLGRIKNLWRR
ncbi:MAG: Stp1/IreP family PP2C-type Ser/Thr phosphatase [Calditrichaeota bacterium]|nr:MAG: Stp1/IreP family PP2C-type Ser/Thr phosphatase [Calditrichota bacterium]